MKKIISIACLMAAGALAADSTPVMVSLVTPVQAPSRSYDVTGVRLSLIYGDCRHFAGLDIGIANRSATGFVGLGIGGFNIAGGQFYGGEVGLVNWNHHRSTSWEERSIGAQVGLLNHADTFCGLQDGIANVADNSFVGLQSGILNCAYDVGGVQCGFYFLLGVNVAGGTLRGCQIGLLNYADTVDRGVQVGLVNVIARNGWCPVLPIVNGHF